MKKLGQFTLIIAILSFVLSMFLFFKPVRTLEIIIMICAVLAIVKGLFDLFSYFKEKRKLKKASSATLIVGLLMIVLGVFLFFAPQFGLAFVGVVFAIWFLLEIIRNLMELFSETHTKDVIFWIAIVFNVISLIFAILLLIFPLYAAISFSLILALYFLFQSIALFLGFIVLRKVRKSI